MIMRQLWLSREPLGLFKPFFKEKPCSKQNFIKKIIFWNSTHISFRNIIIIRHIVQNVSNNHPSIISAHKKKVDKKDVMLMGTSHFSVPTSSFSWVEIMIKPQAYSFAIFLMAWYGIQVVYRFAFYDFRKTTKFPSSIWTCTFTATE